MHRIRTIAHIAISCLSLLYGNATAQEQTSAFGFIEIPQSAHAMALGGYNVSFLSDNVYMSQNNPALLCGLTEGSVSVDYMNYLSLNNFAGAGFGTLVGERGCAAAIARYIGYGKSDMTAPDGTVQGDFQSKDIIIKGVYSYLLTDNLSGGVTAKIAYSHYGPYSSVAVMSDLGIHYLSDSGLFSFGASATNIGGQIKPFNDEYEKLPFNIMAGASIELEHAPIRLHLTLHDLNHWSKEWYYSPDGIISTGSLIKRHCAVGCDFLLSEQLYASIGCNMQCREELVQTGKKGLEGFSIGTGLNLRKMSVCLSFGKIQVATSSLLLNFAVNL